MAEQASGSSDEPSDSPLAAGWGFWLLWALASTVGWAVGGPVGVKLGPSGDIIVAGYVGVALAGILAGVLQWSVLRRQLARAGWWVLASTVGWVVGGPVGELEGWGALGAVYGAITGAVLVWLLRQRPPRSHQPSAVPS